MGKLKEVKTPTLTTEETALARRIANEDGDWQTITESDIEDYSLCEDPYMLPLEAAKAQEEHRYAFKWAEMTDARISELRSLSVPKRWWVCNRENMKFLEKYVDPNHGAIQKQDQILMFKPWWMHEKYQTLKTQMSEAQDMSGNIEHKHRTGTDSHEWLSGNAFKIGNKDKVMGESAGADTFEMED